jgi:hypothetical protein
MAHRLASLILGNRVSRGISQARFFAGIPGFLRTPISGDDARRIVRRRFESRRQRLLRIVRRSVFGDRGSVYRPLFQRAGIDGDALERLVDDAGVNGALAQLHAEGIYVTAEELKGRRPIRRDGLEIRTRPEAFANRCLARSVETASGGTTGRALRTRFDLDYLAERTVYDRIMFDMLDADDVPLAIWYPGLPAVTGVSNSLRYSKAGRRVDRWFRLPDGCGRSSRWSLATFAAVVASRLSPRPVPTPERLETEQAEHLLQWAIEQRDKRGRCIIQSYVSNAVRLAERAREGAMDLTNVLFIVGSEPVTPARSRAVCATGARMFPRYFATEIGSVGLGCGAPCEDGDYHLLSDTVAVIQPDGPGSDLHFTSLLENAPLILINAQLGDEATVEERACGCPLESLGFRTHLRQVHSRGRVTSGGVKIGVDDLARIVEEVLPRHFGGGASAYQWIEQDSDTGRPELTLRIDPGIGIIDESEVIDTALGEIARGGEAARLAVAVWRDTGSVRIVREAPKVTLRGKLLPVIIATSAEDDGTNSEQ